MQAVAGSLHVLVMVQTGKNGILCVGERGLEMVDMLKKNPAVAVEVVLVRLHQKIEEWQTDKAKMTDVWQKIYDANYHKSLDHRSFYFKQASLDLCCCSCPSYHVVIHCNMLIDTSLCRLTNVISGRKPCCKRLRISRRSGARRGRP